MDFMCPICIDFVSNPINASCGHVFCLSCLRKWLKIKNYCPLCKSSVTMFQCDSIYLREYRKVGQSQSISSRKKSIDSITSKVTRLSATVIDNDEYINSLHRIMKITTCEFKCNMKLVGSFYVSPVCFYRRNVLVFVVNVDKERGDKFCLIPIKHATKFNISFRFGRCKVHTTFERHAVKKRIYGSVYGIVHAHIS